ncbi:hypothetical protein [Labrys neptuniae]
MARNRRRSSYRRRLSEMEIAAVTASGFFTACFAGAAFLNWVF